MQLLRRSPTGARGWKWMARCSALVALMSFLAPWASCGWQIDRIDASWHKGLDLLANPVIPGGGTGYSLLPLYQLATLGTMWLVLILALSVVPLTMFGGGPKWAPRFVCLAGVSSLLLLMANAWHWALDWGAMLRFEWGAGIALAGLTGITVAGALGAHEPGEAQGAAEAPTGSEGAST